MNTTSDGSGPKKDMVEGRQEAIIITSGCLNIRINGRLEVVSRDDYGRKSRKRLCNQSELSLLSTLRMRMVVISLSLVTVSIQQDNE